jgi:hypothetical protein
VIENVQKKAEKSQIIDQSVVEGNPIYEENKKLKELAKYLHNENIQLKACITKRTEEAN